MSEKALKIAEREADSKKALCIETRAEDSSDL